MRDEWRAARFTIGTDLLPWFERCLPPEHRVRATREAGAVTEVIVTGPWMTVAEGEPEELLMHFSLSFREGAVRVVGRLTQPSSQKDLRLWTVGDWPDLETYHAEMQCL